MTENQHGGASLHEVKERGGKKNVDLIVDKILIRRISIRLTCLLVRTSITANQVSLLAMAVTLTGVTCLVFRPFYMPAIGGLLMVFGCVLDCCDGEVARFHSNTSLRGVFIDSLSHAVAIPAMFFAAGIGLLVRHGSASGLVFGTLAAIAGGNPAKTALNVVKSIHGAPLTPKTAEDAGAPAAGRGPSMKSLYLKTLGRISIFPNSLFVISLATFIEFIFFPRVQYGPLYCVTLFYAVLLGFEQIAAAASWSRESRLAQEVQK